VRTVTEGAKARTARLDPLGTEIDLGPDFYPALIRDMATRFADCLQ
jgi:zinc transport system substrate-binding protein